MSAESDIDLTAQSDQTNNEIINIEDADTSKLPTKQQSKNFMIDNLLSSHTVINSNNSESFQQHSTFPWSWHSATTSRLENDFLNNSVDKQSLSSSINLNYVKNHSEKDRLENVGKLCSTNDFNSDNFARKDLLEAGSSSADECFGKYDGE